MNSIKKTLLQTKGWRLVEASSKGETWIYIERSKARKGSNTSRIYVLWHTDSKNTLSLGLFPGNCRTALDNPEIPLSIKRVVESYLIMDM